MKKRTRLKAIYFSSIEYMYTLPTEDGPVIILKVANPEEIEKILSGT